MIKMPKIKLNSMQKYNNLFTGIIAKYMCLYDIKAPELAVSLRVCQATLYNRLQHPEKFTIEDFRRLRIKLKIPQEEIIPAIMGGE